MARAQGDHEARSSRKGSNWFKYLWRKAGSKSDAIEPWLHLIPDEYGLSLVRGAIGIVFHMAEKAHEKEKSILEGFEIITDTIRNAMNKGVSFQREPEMHACCQALYDTLVEGIADLIWSLKPEAKGKCSFDLGTVSCLFVVVVCLPSFFVLKKVQWRDETAHLTTNKTMNTAPP